MTHSHVWHVSVGMPAYEVTQVMCDMTHSYMGNDSFIRVTWHSALKSLSTHTTSSLRRHAGLWNYSCHRNPVTWLVHTSGMTHSHVWHDSVGMTAYETTQMSHIWVISQMTWSMSRMTWLMTQIICMSHIWMSHVTNDMNYVTNDMTHDSGDLYVTHMNESCHEWHDSGHLYVTYMNESYPEGHELCHEWHDSWLRSSVCHIYEWVIPQMPWLISRTTWLMSNMNDSCHIQITHMWNHSSL